MVRSALLEVEPSGESHNIERALNEPSTVAFVRRGRLDQASSSIIEKQVITPAGDPPCLSPLLLSHCELEGVEREAPTDVESRPDPLSIRDLMWLTVLPRTEIRRRALVGVRPAGICRVGALRQHIVGGGCIPAPLAGMYRTRSSAGRHSSLGASCPLIVDEGVLAPSGSAARGTSRW